MSEVKVEDKRNFGFYMIDNVIVLKYGADIGPYGLAIYNVLCLHASRDGKSHPSYDTLARLTGMSKRQAMREIDKLVEFELIAKTTSKDGKTNTYQIQDVKPSDTQSQQPQLVTHSHPPSDTQSPPLVTHSHPNKTHSNKTQEQNNSSASLAAARLDETMNKLQPDEETHSDLSPRYDRSEEQQLYQEIVGRTLRPGDKNKLAKLSERATKEQIIRAMSRTAEAAKKGTRINDGVAYACRMVDIVVDEESGKTPERDETYRAIVEGRRGDAAADVDWKAVNRLYSPEGPIDAIPQ